MLMKNILSLIYIIVLTIGCSNAGPPSTETTSEKFDSLLNKISFLEQYVTFNRQYENLDFIIFYQNNSNGFLPGPSDWDVQIIAQIPNDTINAWISNAKTIKTDDTDWVLKIPTNINRSGFSEWYQKEKALIGVNRTQSIIVYRNRSM